MNFLKGKIAELQKVKTKTKSWQRVDLSNCRYRTAARIFGDLGGEWDSSIGEGVVTGIKKCVAMGPPWFHRHPQTNLLEFVIIEFGWAETFTECWSEYQKEVTEQAALNDGSVAAGNENGNADGAGDGKGKGGGNAKGGKGKGDNEKGGKGQDADVGKGKGGNGKGANGKDRKGNGKGGGGNNGEKETKKVKKQASEFKANFVKVTQKATSIHECLEKDESWSKLKASKADLEKHIEKVQKILTPITKKFVMMADHDLKKHFYEAHKEAVIIVDFQNMLAHANVVTKLDKFCDTLNRAHADFNQSG